MLQRARELSVQSANDTNEDRANIQLKVMSLFDEINPISECTEFNGMKLLRGGGGTSGPMLTGQALIDAQTSFTERLVQSTLEKAECMISSDYWLSVSRKMMNFTKQNILMQAAQSMLAQANQQPQGILQLLG